MAARMTELVALQLNAKAKVIELQSERATAKENLLSLYARADGGDSVASEITKGNGHLTRVDRALADAEQKLLVAERDVYQLQAGRRGEDAAIARAAGGSIPGRGAALLSG